MRRSTDGTRDARFRGGVQAGTGPETVRGEPPIRTDPGAAGPSAPQATTPRSTIAILALAALLAFVPVGPAFAQEGGTAAAAGRVETASAEAIAAARVRVLGSERSALTDADGQFRITRLSPGTVSLSFEALGYQSQVVDLDLAVGETSSIEVVLDPAPVSVEGLVITAQKRQQAVQEVPITATVYEGEFLEESGIREFDALSAYVPGLEVQLQSPNNPGFVIRGITSDNGDARVEPRVSVFQDGVSISKSRGSVVELFDMERIEVLKGPQGTLFGRGAEIGAVHLIQNKARNERAAEVSLGPGNYEQWSAEGVWNTPLVEDELFARVAAIYGSRDGYVENLAGGSLNGKETVALRGSLRWAPSEFTDIDLIVNWQQDSPPGTAFNSGVFDPAPSIPSASREEAFLGGDPRFPELGIDRTVWGVTMLADRVLSPSWSLQGVGGFRTFDSYEVFDADGTSAPALHFAEDADGDQLSLEMRALYSGGGRLSGFLGASVFHEDGSQRVPFWTDERSLFPLLTRIVAVESGTAELEVPVVVDGEPNFVETYPPIILGLPFILAPDDPERQAELTELVQGLVGQPVTDYHAEEASNFGRNTAFEIFMDGTLELTDRLEVTAGLRGTWERLRGGFQAPESETPSPLGLVTVGEPGNIIFKSTPDGRKIEREEDFFSVVGRLAASYQLGDDLHLYGTFARGRRPPVIQQTEAADAFEVLNDEIVYSYEAGLKGISLDNRLQWDVGAFYYDYHDFQTNVQPELTGSGIVFRSDQGEATGYGAEMSAQAALAEYLSVFGNYAWVQAEFDDEDAAGDPQELAGNTFRLTPEHSISAGFGYSRMLGDVGELFLRPSYTWKSKVHFEEEHQGGTVLAELAPPLSQDAYGLVNVRAGLAGLLDGRADLELWVNNLTDESYIIDAGNTGINFYAPTYVPGPPLMLGIKLTARP